QPSHFPVVSSPQHHAVRPVLLLLFYLTGYSTSRSSYCIAAEVPCFHLQGSDAGPLVKVFSFHSSNLSPYIPLITSLYAEMGRERINFHVPHGIYYYIMYYERLG